MKEFLASKSFKKFIIFFTLVIIFVIISQFGGTSVISSVVNGVTLPMSQVTAAAAEEATKKSYDQLYAENEALSEEISQLRTQLADYYNVKQENERLWRYYDLKAENPQYDILPASVVRRDPSDDFYSFTLDKGSSSGVCVGDPVVTENGLVGSVMQVDLYTAKVKTILSPDVKVGVIDAVSRDSGIVRGNVLYADQNLTTATQLSAQNNLKAGDIVITTGISGLYPSGLVVGEVKELAFDEYDTSVFAVISPYEDIRTVIDVVVITSFEGQGAISDKGIEDVLPVESTPADTQTTESQAVGE